MQSRLVCCVHIYPFLAPPLNVAPGDYTAVTSQGVTFTSAPDQMCISVSISNDNVVEAAELFAVVLGSSDPAVVIAQPFSSVTINDSTGMHLLSVCLDHYIFCTFNPCFLCSYIRTAKSWVRVIPSNPFYRRTWSWVIWCAVISSSTGNLPPYGQAVIFSDIYDPLQW